MSCPRGAALSALLRMGGHPQGCESGWRHIPACLRSVGIRNWHAAQFESCFELAPGSYRKADVSTAARDVVKRP